MWFLQDKEIYEYIQPKQIFGQIRTIKRQFLGKHAWITRLARIKTFKQLKTRGSSFKGQQPACPGLKSIGLNI